MALLKPPPKSMIAPLRAGVGLLWALTLASAAGALGPVSAVIGRAVAMAVLVIHLIEYLSSRRRRAIPRNAGAMVDVLVFGVLAIWDRRPTPSTRPDPDSPA